MFRTIVKPHLPLRADDARLPDFSGPFFPANADALRRLYPPANVKTPNDLCFLMRPLFDVDIDTSVLTTTDRYRWFWNAGWTKRNGREAHDCLLRMDGVIKVLFPCFNERGEADRDIAFYVQGVAGQREIDSIAELIRSGLARAASEAKLLRF